MANNVNNGITGVIDIPGALRSRGAADGNLVGGVVAYAGDIYDVTAGKNQATLNAEFAEGITNASSSSFSGNYNDLSNIPLLKTADNGFKVNAHGRRKNTASEQDSFAEGAGTTASGQGSHSEGGGTIASGTCSHAEGNNASAVGNSSHAEGYFTTAIGSNSHAEGNNAHAHGNNAHAEGLQETLLPLTTRAYTATSSALYIDTEIFPGCIIYDTDDTPRRVLSCEYQEAGDDYKVVFQGISEDLEIGDEVYVDFCAYGDNSHTEGYDTHAYGESSHAEGVHTITTNEAEHASGMYNMSTANKTLFSVGAGHDGSRMNAFEIDTSSNVYIYGVGGYDGTNSTTTGIKSLQGVISDIESNSSSSSSSYTHPSTHPASMITYDASTEYESGNVGYAIKALQTAISGVPTYSAGTGISISNNTISVDATQLSYNDLLDKLVRDVNYGKGVVIGGQYASPCDVLSGESSVAMGAGAIVADGYGAIAAGYMTSANGWGVSANGVFTYAEGSGAHVEGKGLMDTNAIIRESYTQGNTDIIVNQAFPVGAIILNKNRSAILCYVTNCELYGSYYKLTLSAGLDQNLPSGKNIQIIGYAKGIGAHAEGYGTIAKGDGTHAEGMYTVTNNNAEHACGKYNKSTPEVRIPGNANVTSYGTQFSIGIGSSYTQRVNAFEVLGNGDIYVKGLGSYDGTSISNVSTLLNVITGINTRVTTLENSSSSSSPSSSYITYSEGEGYSLGDTTNASGENSFAEGESTTASGTTSHAEGYSTKASGENAHAEGDVTLAHTRNSHAEGGYTSALGYDSHAEGAGHRMGPLELNTNSEYYYDSTDDVLYIFIDSLSSDSNYLNLPVGTVAAVATEDTESLQYADYYSYISDKLYFVGPVDYECPVIAIKNIPTTSKVGIGHQGVPQVDNGNYKDGWGYKFTSTIYINFLAGTALGDASHSGGYETNAVGQKSNTAGIRTVATNDGESAFGRYNVSEDGTIFSIGCGEWDEQTLYLNSHNYGRDESLTGIKAGLNKYTTSKNALMVTDDGDVFIKGIGGYDGMDSTAQGVKSVQQVIADLTLQIAALTNNL